MTEPLLVAATGPCRMVGARLAPSALHRLLPIAQHDLIGQVIDATSIWNDWTRRTVEQVANAPTADAQLAIFERALEGLLVTRRNVSTVDAVIQRGVWRFEASGGLMSINTLARNAGVSRRQFERYFRAHVGMSPHMFGRIVRFQRAFRGLGHEPAAAIAARCGFADQAHLAREVRRFAGQTPTALAQAEGLTAILR
jgi:AraC-like DNA-binding protein